jgi:cell division protein FtsB
MLRSLGLYHILVLVVIAGLFMMTWDFGRRIVENVQLVQAVQAANARLASVERANAELEQLKKDVVTDEWVERKARSALHYTREGETLFIPINRSLPAPTTAPLVVTLPPTRPFWLEWLESLFGAAK